MRLIEDMKKFIKKKKAFTLVELMGVLVIIGVLSAILIPTISNVIKENKEKLYQSQLENIILSAKNFGSDNIFILPKTNDDIIYVTLGQLKNAGYLDSSIINPRTKKEFSDCTVIKITKIGNNYEYTIEESTIEEEVCDVGADSAITISEPSKKYIKNGVESVYIVTIEEKKEVSNILSYVLDDSKLSITGPSDAKYSVEGSNSVYRVTVTGGLEEGNVILAFGEDAIKDQNGNNVDTTTAIFSPVVVDNTAPECGTWNGQDTTWTNQTRTITMTGIDKVSGIKEGNGFSKTYNVGEITTDDLSYTVEDVAGNTRVCETVANVYVDKTSPTIPNVNLIYNDDNSTYDQVWTNRAVKQIQSSSDSGVGGLYYQYSHDNENWADMPVDWIISWEGSWTFYVRACDELANCSSSAPSYWIGLDLTPPTFTSCTWLTNYTYSDGKLYPYALNCQYSEPVYRRHGNCYDLGANNNGSTTCNYNSLDNRFGSSSFISSTTTGDVFGFGVTMNSGNTTYIKIEIKDTAGNTATNTYYYTQP